MSGHQTDGTSSLILTDNCFICNETLNIFTRGNQTVDEVRSFKRIFCGLLLYDDNDNDDLEDFSKDVRVDFTTNDSVGFCLKCSRLLNNLKSTRDAIVNKLIEKTQTDSQNQNQQTPDWNLKSIILHKWGGEKFAFLADEIKIREKNKAGKNPGNKEKVPSFNPGNSGKNVENHRTNVSQTKSLRSVIRTSRPQEKVQAPLNVEMNPAIAIKIEQITSRLPIDVDFVNSEESAGSGDAEPEQGLNPSSNNENNINSDSNDNDNEEMLIPRGNSDLTINYIPYDENNQLNLNSTPMDYLQIEQNSSRRFSSRKPAQGQGQGLNKEKLKNQTTTATGGNNSGNNENVDFEGAAKLLKPPEPGQTFIVDGVRYYSCRYCSRTFGHRSNKYRHENTVHGDLIRDNYFKRFVINKSTTTNSGSTNSNIVVENNSNNNKNQNQNNNQLRTTTRVSQLPLFNRSRKTTQLLQFQCKVCSRILSSNWSLQNHIQVYHTAEPEPTFRTKNSLRSQTNNSDTFYNCTYCSDGGIGYSSKTDLLNHISRVHPHENSQNQNQNEPNLLEPHNIKCEVTIREVDEEFVMPTLERMDHIDQNQDNHNNSDQDSGEEEEEDISGQNASLSLYPHREDMPHKCRFCGKGFGYIQNKKRHEERHKDPNSLVSKISARHRHAPPPSSLQLLLARRLKYRNRRRANLSTTTQPIRRRVDCQYCGKSLSDMHILRNHIQAFHIGIFNFECYVCGKPYASKDSCRKHERGHDPNRPTIFKCPRDLGCDQRFTKWPQFVNHFELEHPGHQLPRFKQKVRPSGSRRPTNVDEESPPGEFNYHQDNNDDNDGEGSIEDIGLVLNQLKAQSGGQRGGPCQCFICGTRVKNNFMLERHIKAIHGAKPLICRFTNCSRRFGLTSSRTNHEQTHIRRNNLVKSMSNKVQKKFAHKSHKNSSSTSKSIKSTTSEGGGKFEKNVQVSLERLENSPNLSSKIRDQLAMSSSSSTNSSSSPLRTSRTLRTGRSSSTTPSKSIQRSNNNSSTKISTTRSRRSSGGQKRVTEGQLDNSSTFKAVKSLENELITMKSGKKFRCWVCSKEKFHEGFCHYNSIRIHFQRWPKHDLSLEDSKKIMKELNLESEGLLPSQTSTDIEPHDVEPDYPVVQSEELQENEDELQKYQDSKKYSDLIFEENDDNNEDKNDQKEGHFSTENEEKDDKNDKNDEEEMEIEDVDMEMFDSRPN